MAALGKTTDRHSIYNAQKHRFATAHKQASAERVHGFLNVSTPS